VPDPSHADQNPSDSHLAVVSTSPPVTAGQLRAEPKPPSNRQVRRENRILAVVFFGLYTAIGYVLVMHYNSVVGDAISRVANGSFVFRSADPHLAAVGFVWNPLPSILSIPILMLSHLWAPLLTHAFAGNILSAAFMALCVAVTNGLLAEMGLRRRLFRLALSCAFGLTPMIVYYGANGMSEAYLLLTQLIAARALLVWARDRNWRALVVAGVALGIGYFARYEALVSAAGAVAFVAFVTFRSASGPVRERVRIAFTDVWLIGAPAGFAFVVWAGVSWIIGGQPFAQYTSNYGNSTQVIQQGINTGSYLPFSLHHFTITGLQVFALEPVFVVFCLWAVVSLLRRRSDSLLVPFAVFAPVLLFQAYASISGGTFGWWRFYIDAIPMSTILLGLAVLDVQRARGFTARGRRFGFERQRWLRPLAIGAVVVALTAPFVAEAVGVQDVWIASEENPQFELIAHPQTPTAREYHNRFVHERQIAAYLDAKHLPRESILVDAANGFPILIASKHPKDFQITTDRTFKGVLDGVGSNRIQYVLDVPNDARFAADAVNVKWSTFYQNGSGIATLEKEWVSDSDQPSWRLYRVNHHT
jgi:hypothetical protein